MSEFKYENKASVVLASLGRGHADAEFARLLEIVAREVSDSPDDKAKGKVTIALEVRKDPAAGALVLIPTVSHSVPTRSVHAGHVYPTDDGRLLTHMDFLMEAGHSERKDEDLFARAPIAEMKQAAPIADAPKPKPIVDAAGETTDGADDE